MTKRIWKTNLSTYTQLGFLLAMIFLVSGCNNPGSSSGVGVIPSAVNLPPPETFTTKTPDAEITVTDYLNSWTNEDYQRMYSLLTPASQAAISQEEFIQYYTETAIQSTLVELDTNLIEVSSGHQEAEAKYRVIMRTSLAGDLEREATMKLEQVNGQWKVRWDPALILPELSGGNYLRMDLEIPPRGNIYDRNGSPLAHQIEAAAIGVWPDYVDLTDDQYIKGLIPLLSGLSGVRTDTLITMIEEANPGTYLALGEIPADQDPYRLDMLSKWNAAVTARYSSRFYDDNGVAPHLVGYISALQQDELEDYRRKGYQSDAKVGRKGLELWGEEILAGKSGGTLYVFNPDGKPIAQLAATPSQPAAAIYTTLERDFQRGVQRAIAGFSGAIVVLEKDTGRVLAMASSPGFDPNAFQTENYNWNTLLNQILNNPQNPQFTRATQGQYPLGSVFKLITISAALESGRYTPDTQYQCGYVFEELEGFPRYDWTYDHFLENGVTQPSGLLTLSQGLIRSCNPFFWHIGLDLYNQGLTTAISDMARDFGLGEKTGIGVLDEEAGNIPDPTSQVDAINLAIGQGDMTVTPIQVARFAAALGNGGILYRPQAIEKIIQPNGDVTDTFTPEKQGTLPLSPANLKAIQEAMVGVVRSQKPLGTAYLVFRDLDINIAGKTGSVTTHTEDPHAWFAGYTFEGRQDKPDIAIAVIAENAGEGSEIAAPIFRRVIELYFYGKPLKVYRWEATFGVTKSPTPLVIFTATPVPGLTSP